MPDFLTTTGTHTRYLFLPYPVVYLTSTMLVNRDREEKLMCSTSLLFLVLKLIFLFSLNLSFSLAEAKFIFALEAEFCP